VTTDEERVDRGGWVAMTLRRYWGLENCRSLYVEEMILLKSSVLVLIMVSSSMVLVFTSSSMVLVLVLRFLSRLHYYCYFMLRGAWGLCAIAQ